MKTIIAILAIIIVAPILIVVVASREFDGRKYIGRTWEDISRVDRDIHNVNAKGFAIKETSGFIGLNRDSSGNGSCLMGSMEPRVTG